MNLPDGRWREATFANQVFVEMVERAGVEFGDWQATNERANVPIGGGTVFGECCGRACVAVDMCIDEIAQRHFRLSTPTLRLLSRQCGDELRQFARRRAFATPKCAAGVAQLASDRILADENTNRASATAA